MKQKRPQPDLYVKPRAVTKDKPRLKPHSKKAASIERYATELIDQLKPFICLGKQWWKWDGSIWRQVEAAQCSRHAFLIQPPSYGNRSVRMASNILTAMNHPCQCDPEKVPWRGSVWLDEGKESVIVDALNGMIHINLKTGTVEIAEADPWSFATEKLPVSYDPAAKCHIFDYLRESALPDAADQNLLQCFAGYCLLPDYRFQCVLFAHGRPNSGKSLLIYHGLGSVFGDRLMSKVSLEKICNGGDELRHLEQSLVNIGTEIEEHHLDDSNIFNQLTSGESIDAALKYERSRTIKPSCKHIFIGNHPPRWKRGSDAQARRIVMIHFPNDFTAQAKNA